MKKHIYKIRLTLASIVFISTILAVVGFYNYFPINFLNFEFTPLFEKVLVNFSIFTLVSLLAVIIFTIVFGRLYCSICCPLGVLQEIVILVRNKKKFSKQINRGYKYLISAVTFGALIGGSAIILKHIEPYTIFANAISLSVFGLIALGLIILLAIFKQRYFCTNICPVGCLLGIISKFSLKKISIDKEKCVSCGMCEKICQSGCIDKDKKQVDNEICVKCLKCVNECKKEAIEYKTSSKPEVKFNPTRRNLIFATSTLVLLSSFVKVGIELNKSIGKKIKNIILPAGAKNSNEMINKCLNCNLCINNCPNKILSKANDDFAAVHIDFSKGEKYCKFDCNQCSKSCPSGAIKKISLNEKQNTRIAMALINDKCIKCGICKDACPKNAIIFENGKIYIESSKCIGCAKCASVCKAGAVDIYPINEQKNI